MPQGNELAYLQYGAGQPQLPQEGTPGNPLYGIQSQAYDAASGNDEDELMKRIMEDYIAKRYGGGGVLGMANSALADQGGLGGVAGKGIGKGVKALAGLF